MRIYKATCLCRSLIILRTLHHKREGIHKHAEILESERAVRCDKQPASERIEHMPKSFIARGRLLTGLIEDAQLSGAHSSRFHVGELVRIDLHTPELSKIAYILK